MAVDRPSLTCTESADAAAFTAVCAAMVSVLLIALAVGWSWAATPERSFLRLSAILLAVPLLSAAVARIPRARVRGWLRLTGLLVLSNVLFSEMEFLQLVLVHRWFDASVVTWEAAWFGGPIVDRLQAVAAPAVLEGLMFAYVGYAACLPFVGILCERGGGSMGLHHYIVHLALTLTACYFGFLLVPLAGPVFARPEAFPVPLHAGIFTWAGEWIRQHQHYPGGSLPSPHCAATTVMILSLWRFHRKAALVLLPTLLAVYVATVVGRYHYVWDGLAGIGVGWGLRWVTDGLLAALRQRRQRTSLADAVAARISPSSMAAQDE